LVAAFSEDARAEADICGVEVVGALPVDAAEYDALAAPTKEVYIVA
jgi:hypothetical protein